jgi:hypothetical protein
MGKITWFPYDNSNGVLREFEMAVFMHVIDVSPRNMFVMPSIVLDLSMWLET